MVSHAERIVVIGVVRIRFDRAFQILKAHLGGRHLFGVKKPEVVQRIGEIGIQPERILELEYRLEILFQFHTGIAKVIIRFGKFVSGLDDLFEDRLGRFEIGVDDIIDARFI